MDFEKRNLGIITADKCNLDCSYCFLHKNPAYIEQDKKTLEAMNDGSFLNNILKTLRTLGVKIKDFSSMDFWGAETSLHLSEGKKFFEEIIKTFYNIEKISYSSNFLTGIQNHLDFIDIIENNSCKDKVVLKLQISTDGPDFILNETRHYKYSVLKNQVKDFIKTLNTKKLRKVDLYITYKATWPWKIYDLVCSNDNNLKEYIEFLINEENELKDLTINQNVNFSVGSMWGPCLEYPYPYTVEDGCKFSHYARMIDAKGYNKKYGRDVNFPILTSGFVRPDSEKLYTFTNGCGQMSTNLLFRYDGSLSPCSNGFLDDNEKNLEWLKENDYEQYIKSLRTKEIIPKNNIDGTVNLNNIKNRYDFMNIFWKYHHDYVTTVVSAEMYELACANQISRIYLKDSQLLYKHAMMISKQLACYFNCMRETGSAYVPKSDLIKLYCNGLTEYAEQRVI